MKIFIATDVTIRTCEDKVYARAKYSTILRRYYNAFGKIVLCSRVERIETIIDDCDDITDIVSSLVPMQSLMNSLLGRNNNKMRKAMRECCLVIGRCPSISSYRAYDCAKKMHIPFYAESMGCAWDAYWNHGITGKIIAPYMFFKMKSVVKNADYALYVTNEFLQKRYPRKGSSIAASNVLISNIEDDIFEKRVRHIHDMDAKHVTLMTTAAVNVKYKGQQYVIAAIPKLNAAGIKIKYYIVGEGDNSFLKAEVKKYKVEGQVIFTGRLPLDKVFELLDQTDIYIQPSLQEGLPRSVIEAMSRGCIAVGARTAGIPELLEKEYVVRRKNEDDIVKVITKISKASQNTWLKVARRNFEEAKKFENNILEDRRNQYYSEIKKLIQSQRFL